MGCFNVAGTMSGISIGAGTKVVFFLLSPAKYKMDLNEPCSYLVSNECSTLAYQPFCPPIRAKYNDYGSLEEIVKDKTTEALESYFGATIEEIIDHVTTHYKDETDKFKNLDKLNSLAGMFEFEEVYDYMVNVSRKDNRIWDNCDFNHYMMTEVLGYTLIGIEECEHIKYSKSRYNKKYVRNNITIYTDGSYLGDTILIDDKPFNIGSVFALKDIAKLIGADMYVHNRYKLECSYGNWLFNREQLKSQFEEIKQSIIDQTNGDIEKANQLAESTLFHKMLVSDERCPIQCTKLFGEQKDQLDLQYFTYAMHSANKFYYPAMNGEQHGNVEVERHLNTITAKIILDKFVKYDY